jgi:hypothetical protein
LLPGHDTKSALKTLLSLLFPMLLFWSLGITGTTCYPAYAGAGASVRLPTGTISPDVAIYLGRGRLTPPWTPSTPDTFQTTGTAGTTVIVALPDSVGKDAVSRYRVLTAPTLSWLHAQSFFWITRDEDRGEFPVVLGADRRTGVDTLVVILTLE